MKRKRKPQAKCYDKDWKYTPSVDTDIRRLFSRERERLAKAEADKAKVPTIGRKAA